MHSLRVAYAQSVVANQVGTTLEDFGLLNVDAWAKLSNRFWQAKDATTAKLLDDCVDTLAKALYLTDPEWHAIMSLRRLVQNPPADLNALREMIQKAVAALPPSGRAMGGLLEEFDIIDVRGFARLSLRLSREDPDLATSMEQALEGAAERLSLKDNQEMALRMLRRMALEGQTKDLDTLRNQAFKAADLLGLKLPHGFF